MNTPLATRPALRVVAGLTAACITYVLFGGVVSLAGGDPRSHEVQMSKAQSPLTVASTGSRDARAKKL